MTSSTANKFGQSTQGHKAFTLIELMVVVAIIVALIAILMPMLNIATRNSNRLRMQSDMQVISAGLEAYKSDMRDYPSLDYTDSVMMSAQNPGATLLCWALLGSGDRTQDGADGPGFKLPQDRPDPANPGQFLGQKYGPYVEPGQIKVGHDAGTSAVNPKIGNGATNAASKTEPDAFITDRLGHPVLYFRANQAAKATTGSTTYFANVAPSGTSGIPAGSAPYYNLFDNFNAFVTSAATFTGSSSGSINQTYATAAAQAVMGWQLNGSPGTVTAAPPSTTSSNWALGTPAATIPYILWSAGPDEQYGLNTSLGQPKDPTWWYDPTIFNTATAGSLSARCDDVTNFRP